MAVPCSAVRFLISFFLALPGVGILRTTPAIDSSNSATLVRHRPRVHNALCAPPGHQKIPSRSALPPISQWNKVHPVVLIMNQKLKSEGVPVNSKGKTSCNVEIVRSVSIAPA